VFKDRSPIYRITFVNTPSNFCGYICRFSQSIASHLFEMKNPEKILENTEVIAIASKLLIIAAVFQISEGVQAVVLGALKGLQDVKIPAIITFISYWLIGFPISYYLGLKTDLGAIGVWIGL